MSFGAYYDFVFVRLGGVGDLRVVGFGVGVSRLLGTEDQGHGSDW